MNERIFVLRNAGIRSMAMAFVGDRPVLDPPLEIIIRVHKAKRSLSENAKYWALLTEIGNHLGYDRDDMHDVFRQMFLPLRWLDMGDGRERSALTSTAKLSVGGMAAYIDAVERWAAENGIPLRLPAGDVLQTVAVARRPEDAGALPDGGRP